MKTLSNNEISRLAALIAGPLKEDGTTAVVAKPTVENAVKEFCQAFRNSLGVTVDAGQRDEIISKVLAKLG